MGTKYGYSTLKIFCISSLIHLSVGFYYFILNTPFSKKACMMYFTIILISLKNDGTIKLVKICVIKVAAAAPLIPQSGIIIALRIIFVIVICPPKIVPV